jgi:primosomal protein N'
MNMHDPDHLVTKVGDRVLVRWLSMEITGTVVGHRADEDEPYPLTLVRLDTKTGSTVPVSWHHMIEVLVD